MLARWLRLLPIASASLLLRVVEFLDQLLIAGRFLDRIEIRALNVLDERELGDLLIAQIADDHRDVVQACALGGPPAPLAGDDLVTAALAIRAGDNRLHQALGTNGICEVGQLRFVEGLARVAAARMQLRDGQQALLAVHGQSLLGRWSFTDQRGKTATEPALLQRYNHGNSYISDVRHSVFPHWLRVSESDLDCARTCIGRWTGFPPPRE